eukprot:11020677-Alexandrium_andersonii.AAC.1
MGRASKACSTSGASSCPVLLASSRWSSSSRAPPQEPRPAALTAASAFTSSSKTANVFCHSWEISWGPFDARAPSGAARGTPGALR